VACGTAPCGTSNEDRATAFAWILHLAGDIHQPLHTSARVTTESDERRGDQGGNLFTLAPASTGNPPLPLHSYWDGIIDRAVPRQPGESEPAYVVRVSAVIVTKHPPAQLSGRVKSGDFAAWSREGLSTTKNEIYPGTLKRGQMPTSGYRARALSVAEEAIALAGYRLADLLNRMFGG
jgi:hypothetical protein